jgi:hypothetical protein
MGSRSIADIVPALLWEHPPGTPSLRGAASRRPVPVYVRGSGNGPPILAPSGGKGTPKLSARQPGRPKAQHPVRPLRGCDARPRAPRRAASPGPTGRDGRPDTPFGCAREGETAPWHRAASRSGAEGAAASCSAARRPSASPLTGRPNPVWPRYIETLPGTGIGC